MTEAIRAIALAAIGVSAHGERRVTAAIKFTGRIVAVNTLAWQQEGDILIVDALAFGVHHHRAFVVEGGEIVTADADGIRLLDKSDLALAQLYGGHVQ